VKTRAIIAATVLAAGCGGGTGAGGGTPVPAAEFPARFASAWCGLIQRCCQASGGTPTNVCEADITAEITAMGTEAAADGATWEAGIAGQCLAAIATADCAGTNVQALVALLNTCDDTWRGIVPAGGACMTYASCAELPVSGGATAGASCVNSMCVPVVRQPVGAPCDNTTFVCDAFTGGCAGGMCVAIPGPGQACAGDCRVGSTCRNNVCDPLLGLGAACTVDNDCISDRCSAGKCASTFATEAAYCTLP
jgi:hypothetical protein